MSSIEELEQTLGMDGLRQFLEYSIPLFRENLAELLEALEKQRWDDAAAMAHKMQATAGIFSTPIFCEGLDSVRKKSIALIGTSDFINSLKQQTKKSLQHLHTKYQIDISN